MDRGYPPRRGNLAPKKPEAVAASDGPWRSLGRWVEEWVEGRRGVQKKDLFWPIWAA